MGSALMVNCTADTVQAAHIWAVHGVAFCNLDLAFGATCLAGKAQDQSKHMEVWGRRAEKIGGPARHPGQSTLNRRFEVKQHIAAIWACAMMKASHNMSKKTNVMYLCCLSVKLQIR